MRKFLIFLFPFVMLLALFSCTHYTTRENFSVLSINMKKEEALMKLKGKGYLRGSILNKYGQIVEVWEYKVEKGNYWLDTDYAIVNYWLYFYDGELIQWGEAGDWEQAQKKST